MLYREAGQYKTSYSADMAVFPIRQDRIGIAAILLVAFVAIPLTGNEFLLNAVMIPFLVFALAAIGILEPRTGWKRFPKLYEVRGDDRKAMYVAIMSVLDREKIWLNVIEESKIEDLERVTFEVSAPPKVHARVLAELQAAVSTGKVVVFREQEEE